MRYAVGGRLTTDEGKLSIANLVLAPLGCLFQLSMPVLMVGALVLALVGGYIYTTANTDFFGLADPKFDGLTISPSFERIESPEWYWQITFEKPDDSQFAGRVRHVSPIRQANLRILTHDILVTSGEFANPAIVTTSVLNHHFSWQSRGKAQPAGTINLLHVVPASESIYRQLLDIRTEDKVSIGGREILKIDIYNQGAFQGDWRDTGCNSILAKWVKIDRAR